MANYVTVATAPQTLPLLMAELRLEGCLGCSHPSGGARSVQESKAARVRVPTDVPMGSPGGSHCCSQPGADDPKAPSVSSGGHRPFEAPGAPGPGPPLTAPRHPSRGTRLEQTPGISRGTGTSGWQPVCSVPRFPWEPRASPRSLLGRLGGRARRQLSSRGEPGRRRRESLVSVSLVQTNSLLRCFHPAPDLMSFSSFPPVLGQSLPKTVEN